MQDPKIALVGAGTMGANHARVVSESLRAVPGVIIDLDAERAGVLAKRYGFTSSTNVEDAATCDVAILATATSAHTEIALMLLEKGIPLLIEKPISSNVEEMQLVCDTARRLGVPIACGFVERFNAVLDTTMQVLTETPMHIVTMRHSPRTPRITNSVIHDLLIHDIDLVLRFMGDRKVTKVSGSSWAPGVGEAAEIADCIIEFGDGGIATLSASRAGQRKLRSVEIFTSTTLAEVDLLRADLTIYRNVSQEQPAGAQALTYRAETIVDIPFVRHTDEPLARQFDHFLDLVAGDADMYAEIDGIAPPHVIAHLVELECLNRSQGRVLSNLEAQE